MSFLAFPHHPSSRIVVLRLRQSQLSSSASTCDDQPIRTLDYRRQISLLCLILPSPNWNISIQVLHHVKPIKNEGFMLPLKVGPSVWNRQHLQQATMAVQGPESQKATKQLASVPAPKKNKFWKKHIECWQCKYNIPIAVIEGHISSLVCRVCTPFEVLRGKTVCPPSLGTVWSQIKRPCDGNARDIITSWFP